MSFHSYNTGGSSHISALLRFEEFELRSNLLFSDYVYEVPKFWKFWKLFGLFTISSINLSLLAL